MSVSLNVLTMGDGAFLKYCSKESCRTFFCIGMMGRIACLSEYKGQSNPFQFMRITCLTQLISTIFSANYNYNFLFYTKKLRNKLA